MKLKYLFVIFLFATVFFFVYQFPARIIGEQVSHPKIKNFHPVGTIWNAKAEGVMFDDMLIDEIYFGLKPLSVFSEKKSIDFAFLFNDNGKIAGTWHTPLDMQSGTIKDMVGAFKLKPLLQSILKPRGFLPPIVLDALVQSNIVHLDWRKTLKKIDGTITITKIQVGSDKPLDGRLNIKIKTKNNIIHIAINSDKKSAINITGQITIRSTGAYKANFGIAKTKNTPKNLSDALSLFNINGNQIKKFTYSGNLAQIL